MRTVVLAHERCNFVNLGKIRALLKVAVRNDDYPTFQRIIREGYIANQRIAPPKTSLGYGFFVPALRYMGKYKKEAVLEKLFADKEILAHLKSRQVFEPGTTWVNHRDDWYYVDIAVGAIKGGHQGLFLNCIDAFCGGNLDRMGTEARWRITNAAIKVDNFEVANKFGLRAFSWADGRVVPPKSGRSREILGGSLLVQSCVEGSKRCMEGFGAEFVRLVTAWYELHRDNVELQKEVFTRIR